MNLGKAYRAAAKVAGSVIQGAGVGATYVVPDEPVFDPDTGTVTALDAEYAVSVVFEAISAHLIDGTTIQAGDRWALVAAHGLSVVPSTAGRLKVGETEYQIVRVEPLKPGDVALYYRLQVRT